ncbi:exported hypothetical protein [Gammaproteobacteria bacterium]
MKKSILVAAQVLTSIILVCVETSANAGILGLANVKVASISIQSVAGSNAAMKGVAYLHVTGGVLASPCSGLWVDSTDKLMQATLVSAKKSDKVMNIAYDNQAASPWGDNSWCRLDTVELL